MVHALKQYTEHEKRKHSNNAGRNKSRSKHKAIYTSYTVYKTYKLKYAYSPLTANSTESKCARKVSLQ